MKKLEFYIEGSGLELPPLVRDSEGYLRGGFIGIGGADIALAPNWGCKNYTCSNNHCTNHSCGNGECSNYYCGNDSCYNLATTTSTTVTAKIAATGLLI